MWTTIALIAALNLAPAQAGELTLSNLRSTYGMLGPQRASKKYIPGDLVVVSFDIDGIKADDSGKVLYSIGLEVTDPNGKLKFKRDPRELEANISLGGNTLPAYASVPVHMDDPPGQYTAKMTVTDLSTKASKSISGNFEVLPKAFGIANVSTTLDSEMHAPAPFLGTGQSLWVNFHAIGFERAGGQPNLSVEMKVLDENGKPTLKKPFTGEVNKDIPEKVIALPMQFLLELNRPGKFTVELNATDKVTGKKATLSFPITVMQSK
jgi:hypothetical protein